MCHVQLSAQIDIKQFLLDILLKIILQCPKKLQNLTQFFKFPLFVNILNFQSLTFCLNSKKLITNLFKIFLSNLTHALIINQLSQYLTMSEGFVLILPQEFGWVMLTAVLMGLTCLSIGFIFAGGVRTKVFTEEYLKENFGAEHKRVTGQEIKKGGYPDTGSGFYSRNLNYEQWYLLNNGQRAHMNFVEWIGASITFLVVAGVYFPVLSSVLGVAIILFRILYAIGYTSGGAYGLLRLIGALGNDLVTVAHMVLAVITCVKFINGTQYSLDL